MNYTIQNDMLTVVISDAGAELQSMKTADGTEYLWQADPKYWDEKAPNIFPYVARLTNGTYTWNGKSYEMQIHGFLKYMVLQVEDKKEDSITFVLRSNDETKRQYPADFVYKICYSLCKNTLITTTTVDNCCDESIYFAVGGHPGFRVPLEDGLAFDDYYLEFSQTAHPTRIGFSKTCFLTGQDDLFELADGDRIPMHHDMFDKDAIVLKHTPKCVTLKTDKGTKSVKVTYSDFQYIGFWHMPGTDAPYVCIEPWSSLPSRQDVVEDFSQQSDLIHLHAGKTYETTWTIEIN